VPEAVNIGIITDTHYYPGADPLHWPRGGGLYEWRIYSTAPARFAAFIATVNAKSVNFNIQLGDVADFAGAEGGLENFVSDAGALNDDIYYVVGNHENLAFADLTGYFSRISSIVPAGTENGWRPSGKSGNWAYTFDRNGFRFIVLWYAAAWDSDESTWLANTALDTALPVVVVTHYSIRHDGSHFGANAVANNEAVHTILKNSGIVQAVIQSHHHYDGGFCMVDDIPYITARGSVLAEAEDDTTHNAYYIYEITPNVYQGYNQTRAKIMITGYGKYGSDFEVSKWMVA